VIALRQFHRIAVSAHDGPQNRHPLQPECLRALQVHAAAGAGISLRRWSCRSQGRNLTRSSRIVATSSETAISSRVASRAMPEQSTQWAEQSQMPGDHHRLSRWPIAACQPCGPIRDEPRSAGDYPIDSCPQARKPAKHLTDYSNLTTAR
jgi:hypothetical protein